MWDLKNAETKLVMSNTVSQFIVKIISSSTTFIVTLAIVYFLGVSEFGSFTKVITFVSLFYLLVNFGINTIYLRDYFKEAEKYFLNIIILRILISVVLIVLAGIIALLLPYSQQTQLGFSLTEKFWIIVFSLTIATQGLFLSTNAIFQKNNSYNLSIMPTVLSSLANLILIAFGGLTKNILLVILAFPISQTVYFLISYSSIRNRFPFKNQTINFIPFSKKILSSSLPLGLMLFLNFVYFRADTLILSVYKPSADVGIYGFSYKMFEFLIAFPTFFANSIYPTLIEKQKDNLNFYKLIKKYFLFLFFASFIFLAIVYFLSPLVKLVRSDLYPSVIPLRILSLSIPFFFVTSLLQWIFILKNKLYALLVIYIFSTVFNIILNMIFIPASGYIAASYITVASEALVFLLMIIFILKTGFLKKSTENVIISDIG